MHGQIAAYVALLVHVTRMVAVPPLTLHDGCWRDAYPGLARYGSVYMATTMVEHISGPSAERKHDLGVLPTGAIMRTSFGKAASSASTSNQFTVNFGYCSR